MLVVHPVERQSGGVLQSSRVNTIAEDSRSSKANSWCRNRLRRICSSQVPLQYRVVELGTWARQRQKRLKTLTISQSRILQNRVVQDNEMRDARRLLPTNAAYVSSHSPGDQYHSECAEQSKLTSCAHQQAHQQSLCTSTGTVHINRHCAHQQSLCTSTVTVHINSHCAYQQLLCTSAVTVHINSYCAHQQLLCTSAVTMHISSHYAHQQLLCTSTVTVHISSYYAHQQLLCGQASWTSSKSCICTGCVRAPSSSWAVALGSTQHTYPVSAHSCAGTHQMDACTTCRQSVSVEL